MLIKAAFIDLNNVGENFQSFEQELPEVVGEVITLIGSEDPILTGRAQRAVTRLRMNFWRHPLYYYPIFWEQIARLAVSNERAADLGEALFKRFLELYGERINIYPDFLPLLDGLRVRQRLRVVLLANGHPDRIERFLRKFRIRDHVDAIFASGATPYRKPDSEFFRLALDAAEVGPSQAVHIGDRIDTDVIGGNRAGLWTVRLRRGIDQDREPKGEEETPDFEVSSLEEVSDLQLYRYKPVDSAVVACGGRGTRLKDLGDRYQKCLIPVGGVPVLDRVIDRLVSTGVRKFHFLLNYRAEEVIDHVSQRWVPSGVEVHFHQPKASSTAEAVFRMIDDLPEIFFYCHGDIIVPDSIFKPMLRAFYGTAKSVFVVTQQSIATTHPVFHISPDGSITSVMRHPRDGVMSEAWCWSVGLALVIKQHIKLGVNAEEQQTFEQMLAPSLDLLVPVYLNRAWFHLEKPADIDTYSQYELTEMYHVDV